MKKWIWALIIIIIAVVGVFIYFKGKKDKVDYITVKPQKGDITSIIDATGEIKPKKSVDVGCQVTGKVVKVYVDFNSKVYTGQPLAEIDPTKYKANVIDQTATYNQAKETLIINENNINKAKYEISNLKTLVNKSKAIVIDKKRTLDRYKSLVDSNFISKMDVDTADTNYITSEEDLASAILQLKQAEISLDSAMLDYSKSQEAIEKAQANLDSAQADLSYTNIISPVNGIVIAKKIDEGQTVVSNFQTTTLFTIANNLSDMEVHAKINESDIGSIKAGQKVEIKVDAYPGKTFSGKISQVRYDPEKIDNIIYYNAIIQLKNPELILKPGMTAQLKINTSHKAGVLKIQNDAMRFIPSSPELQQKLKELRANKTGLKTEATQTTGTLWLIKDKKPVPVDVVLGLSDDKFTEIVEGPVTESDEIVTGEKTK